MTNIVSLLTEAKEMEASDLHISPGLPPMVRQIGEIKKINRQHPPLSADETRQMIFDIMTREKQMTLQENGEVDFSYSIEKVSRFRCNVFRASNTYSAAFRIINDTLPSFETLRLPAAVRKFADLKKGLVLVTGPTGSGKSTTLAAFINYINQKRKSHIITLEDPIEYLHPHKSCIVNQREIGRDTQSFATSLRSALREDPDILLVGEMRDLETISAAITAAETGHLVFSTLHTIDSMSTINRILDVFPAHQQQQVRTQLASVLEGVISQRLVANAFNTKRIAAVEVLLANDAVRNLIRENKTHQISSILQTNTHLGMQSLDAHLTQMANSGQISIDTAIETAIDKPFISKLLQI